MGHLRGGGGGGGDFCLGDIPIPILPDLDVQHHDAITSEATMIEKINQILPDLDVQHHDAITSEATMIEKINQILPDLDV